MASTDDTWLSIGEFAARTGLTPKALRLYDKRELLCPADMDPSTGYRRYSVDQVAECLGLSARSVARQWRRARAALYRQLSPETVGAL